MEQLLEFLTNHPGLTAAFLVTSALLLWTLWASASSGLEKLSPMDATRLMNHEDALILDVRTDGEFQQGHILNAVHVPQQRVAEQLEKLEKYKGRPIIVACRSGQRSASVGGLLRRKGFERVYNLGGGILAWENANLPLSKK